MIKHHLIILLIALTSCGENYPREFSEALKLPKNNKSELIKVLKHYKDKDNLKYEAACFLIANMPFHKTEKEIVLTDDHHAYFIKTDSIYEMLFGQKITE